MFNDFRFKKGDKTIQPINLRYSKIKFLNNAIDDLEDEKPHGLLIVVKSAVKNVAKRQAIRQTWGQSRYLNDTRISKSLPTKLVFISGVPKNLQSNSKSKDKIYEKLFPHELDPEDIILGDFVDSYVNNTYKSILALKWGVEEFAADFEYMLLVDDDMYMDLENLRIYLETFPRRKFIKNYEEILAKNFPFYRQTTIYNKNYSVTSGSDILRDGLYMGQV